MQYHKGKFVEAVFDAYSRAPLSLYGLMVYHRSTHLKLLRNDEKEQYESLKEFDPKPLFDFRGHSSIKDEWFTELLLYDFANRDLVIDTSLLRHSSRDFLPSDIAKYESGRFIISPGTQIIVAESGIVWSEDEKDIHNQMITSWSLVENLMSRKANLICRNL